MRKTVGGDSGSSIAFRYFDESRRHAAEYTGRPAAARPHRPVRFRTVRGWDYKGRGRGREEDGWRRSAMRSPERCADRRGIGAAGFIVCARTAVTQPPEGPAADGHARILRQRCPKVPMRGGRQSPRHSTAETLESEQIPEQTHGRHGDQACSGVSTNNSRTAALSALIASWHSLGIGRDGAGQNHDAVNDAPDPCGQRRKTARENSCHTEHQLDRTDGVIAEIEPVYSQPAENDSEQRGHQLLFWDNAGREERSQRRRRRRRTALGGGYGSSSGAGGVAFSGSTGGSSRRGPSGGRFRAIAPSTVRFAPHLTQNSADPLSAGAPQLSREHAPRLDNTTVGLNSRNTDCGHSYAGAQRIRTPELPEAITMVEGSGTACENALPSMAWPGGGRMEIIPRTDTFEGSAKHPACVRQGSVTFVKP